MKSVTSIYIDSKLLAEVRRGGVNLSKLIEEKLREYLAKQSSPEQKIYDDYNIYQLIKKDVYVKLQLYPEEMKVAIRKANFLGLPSSNLAQKIALHRMVLDIFNENRIKKESTPTTPKEGD